jgi:hypothetical protein
VGSVVYVTVSAVAATASIEEKRNATHRTNADVRNALATGMTFPSRSGAGRMTIG